MTSRPELIRAGTGVGVTALAGEEPGRNLTAIAERAFILHRIGRSYVSRQAGVLLDRCFHSEQQNCVTEITKLNSETDPPRVFRAVGLLVHPVSGRTMASCLGRSSVIALMEGTAGVRAKLLDLSGL